MRLVETIDLQVSYKPFFAQATTVLHGINFHLNEGEIIGLIGHNGAGKTTFLRSVLGMMIPERGTVKVLGLDPVRNRNIIMNKMGVILDGQRDLPARWTVWEVLHYASIIYSVASSDAQKRISYCVDTFGLSKYKNSVITTLSRGTKQKVILALAMIHNPKILIFDEPFIGIDQTTSENFQILISELVTSVGLSAIFTSHQLGFIEKLSNRIVIISQGKIIADENLEILVKKIGQQAIKITFENINEAAFVGLETHGIYLDSLANSIIAQADVSTLFKVFEVAKKYQLTLRNLNERVGIDEVFNFFAKQDSKKE